MLQATINSSPSASVSSVPAQSEPNQVVVTNVLLEHGKLFVSLAGPQRDHFLEVQAKVLLDFPLFRDFVLESDGVAIAHKSQDAPGSRRRNFEWQFALKSAHDRGCGR